MSDGGRQVEIIPQRRALGGGGGWAGVSTEQREGMQGGWVGGGSAQEMPTKGASVPA